MEQQQNESRVVLYNVEMPPEMRAALKARAGEEQRSAAAVVRRLIQKWLDSGEES